MSFISTFFKVFIYGVSWWVVPIFIGYFYRKKLRRYPVKVCIYEKRGENLVYNEDMAGRFEKPIVCYRLKMSHDTVPIPDYDWILQNVSKPQDIFQKFVWLLCGRIGTITLLKYGSKQYKPVHVKIGSETKKVFKEIKGKDGQPIWVTVYEHINVKDSLSRIDFEVIDWDDINHMTQEIRASLQRRSKAQDFLAKYGPMIGFGMAAFAFLFAVYYGYKLIIDAGSTYIGAAQKYADKIESTNQPSTPELPLDDYLPE